LRKFPDIDIDDWTAANKKMITEELAKYEGLFKEKSVIKAFQELLIEYLYLQNANEKVMDWRDNFMRFLTDEMEKAEARRGSGRDELYRGRLSLVRNILQWF
jgi:hypothetical protein